MAGGANVGGPVNTGRNTTGARIGNIKWFHTCRSSATEDSACGCWRSVATWFFPARSTKCYCMPKLLRSNMNALQHKSAGGCVLRGGRALLARNAVTRASVQSMPRPASRQSLAELTQSTTRQRSSPSFVPQKLNSNSSLFGAF